jgi:hypothetical protein
VESAAYFLIVLWRNLLLLLLDHGTGFLHRRWRWPALSHRGFDHGVGGFPNSGRFGGADLGRAYPLVV